MNQKEEEDDFFFVVVVAVHVTVRDCWLFGLMKGRIIIIFNDLKSHQNLARQKKNKPKIVQNCHEI